MMAEFIIILLVANLIFMIYSDVQFSRKRKEMWKQIKELEDKIGG